MSVQFIVNAKQKIKTRKDSTNPVVRFAVSNLYKFWKIAGTAKHLFVDADFCSVFLLEFLNSKNLHQTASLTYMNRYPEIFSACRDYFDGKKDMKILSYGCSTGEEVLTLRQYFPDAQIIGAEINRHSLAVCRKLPVDDKISFVYSESSEIEKHGNFDVVFCMAVFQRKPHFIAAKKIKSLKKIYPFEKFERQIIVLDKLIKPQGLFVINFTQYSFGDTSVNSKYEVLGNNKQNFYNLLFDKDSSLVNDPNPQDAIFIKVCK